MKLLSSYFLGFSWSRKTIFFEDTDASEFHHKTCGNIYLFKDETKTLVGKFEVTYINIIGALNAGISIFDVFDQSCESFGFYESLMSEADDVFFKAEINEICGTDISLGNLLIIDRLEIIKKYRGHLLGTEAIRRIEKLFGAGASLVALKAFPLQYEKSNLVRPKNWVKKMGFKSQLRDFESSMESLTKHYESIGFIKICDDGLMLKMIE